MSIEYGYLESGTFPAATGDLPRRVAGRAEVNLLDFDGVQPRPTGRAEVASNPFGMAVPSGVILSMGRVDGRLVLRGWDLP